jgi:TM2 domain-containing membrane protein YozV
MKVIAVRGTLQTLGEYTYNEKTRIKRYDYLSLLGDDGRQTVVRKVTVWQDVDRLLDAGSEGTFIFSKSFFSTELHAIKVFGQEATSQFIDEGLGKAYFGIFVGIIFAALLSIVLIGIPLLLLLIWTAFRLPSWRAKIVAVAKGEGFALQRTQRL